MILSATVKLYSPHSGKSVFGINAILSGEKSCDKEKQDKSNYVNYNTFLDKLFYSPGGQVILII